MPLELIAQLLAGGMTKEEIDVVCRMERNFLEMAERLSGAGARLDEHREQLTAAARKFGLQVR